MTMTSLNRRLLRAPLALLAILPALLAARSAHAQNVVMPNVALPASEPTTTKLWGSAASLQARISGTSSAAHYAAVKSDVDAHLASLAAGAAYNDSDETVTELAKEAALLAVLNVTPPQGSAFTSYADAAVAALTHVSTRESGALGNSDPPPTINILQDSPRLQSMAEAYDLLRGASGCDACAANDSAMRSIISTWADAVYGDGNLNGSLLGIGAHRDNWALKGGSALITAALSISAAPDAGEWMTFGNAIILASMIDMGSSAGWYRESAHYLNYSLDDLFSTAVQVQNVTGTDWLTPLKPFAQAAFDLRQPDGTEAPFEDGVPCVFPFDVFAPYYADIGGELVWAWNNSNQDTDNWTTQQPYEATRYLAGELPAAVAPTGRLSRFANGDAHISALRSGFDANAVQGTLFAARDFADETNSISTSRHDTNNPLDLEVAGGGQILMPTSSGGPQVTESVHRAYYLLASSKNVPLLNGGAPYITDGSKLASDLQLAGRDDNGLTGRYLDLSRATVKGAYSAPAIAVARTMALVGGQYLAVVDEMDLQAGQTPSLTLPMHGRGTFSTVAQFHSPMELSWLFTGVALDTFTIGSTALTLNVPTSPGYYASSYGVEETIQAANISQTASASGAPLRALTLYAPRAAAALPLQVDDRTQSTGGPLPGLLAARVTQGAIVDHIATAPQPYVLSDAGVDAGPVLSDAGVEQTLAIDGVSSDAIFSSVREQSGAVLAFGVGRATTLSFDGNSVLFSTSPINLSFNAVASDAGVALGADGGTAAGYVGELSSDVANSNSFTVRNLAGFNPGVAWSATYEDQPLAAPHFSQLADGFAFGGLTGGGTITVVPQGATVMPPIPDQTVAEGSLLQFIVPATAPQGQTLTFSVASAQTFAAPNQPTIDPITGAFSWTPGYDVATVLDSPRDVLLIVTASTSTLSVSQALHVHVINTDRPPVLQPLGQRIVRRESNIVVDLVGSDPDVGDTLTYSYAPETAFPSPAPIFDSHLGTWSWNATATAPLGTYAIDFTVSDGELSATQTLQLIVQGVNRPPVFTTVNGNLLASPTSYEQQSNVNTEIKLQFDATDPDGDTLSYTALQPRGALPTGATFDPATHTLTWTPNAVGSTTVVVTADDGYGGQAQLIVTLDVVAGGGCTSGGIPGPLALLLCAMLLARMRRRADA